jgi:glutamine amidotransferase
MSLKTDEKIGIISIGIGNTESVASMLNSIGIENSQVSNPNDIKFFNRLILPGVGHFGSFIHALDKHGFRPYLSEFAIKQKLPILGLCVGAQAMLNSSEEDISAKGLGWIEGSNKLMTQRDSKFIPRVGWDYLNLINQHEDQVLINSLLPPNRFYFTHSFKFDVYNRANIIAVSQNNELVPVVFMQDNILGAQFHPEKSHNSGLNFLKFFSEWNFSAA